VVYEWIVRSFLDDHETGHVENMSWTKLGVIIYFVKDEIESMP
jgi:hypothetical protein